MINNRSVSPVIGVILMVAITVILSAVIASFVLSFDSYPTDRPQATFEVSIDNNGATIRHIGGETLKAHRVRVRGHNVETGTWEDLASNNHSVYAGNTLDINVSDRNDYRLEVIWVSEDTETSYVLAESSS